MSGKIVSESPIVNWYAEKHILITGATGFIGKVLVEKLLRSCPNLGKIYIIVRSKRGVKPDERLKNILNAPLFDVLRKENPNVFNKIIVLSGDMTEPNLGLEPEDRSVLAENVSVIFHSAATVKFDEPLKKAVDINIFGPQKLVDLCYQMKKLKAFIHVSTAYSNCNLDEIDEIIYPPPTNLNNIMNIVETMDDQTINDITPKLIQNRPNTYTFSKALAENFLFQHSKFLPVVIFRPSIVGPTWKEPMSGWTDSLNGPVGLTVGTGKGIIRSIHCNTDLVADIIPVDIVVNMIICVAWKKALTGSSEISVYNCTSGVLNPITWKISEIYQKRYSLEYPTTDIYWYPANVFKKSLFCHLFCHFLFHLIPAYAFDLVKVIRGQKPVMKIIHFTLQSLLYFVTWIFFIQYTSIGWFLKYLLYSFIFLMYSLFVSLF